RKYIISSNVFLWLYKRGDVSQIIQTATTKSQTKALFSLNKHHNKRDRAPQHFVMFILQRPPIVDGTEKGWFD
ncbi:hypothetical protein ACJX0J_006916, partial [Zea mays]